jgi:hypothetical protein
MNDLDKLNLQKMISANNVEDVTDDIRRKKHSTRIRNDVKQLVSIRTEMANLGITTDQSDFDNLCIANCNFLFNNYTDIYNKIKKNEIDLNILNTFLDVLEQIENGELDQHTGSFKIGNILKQLYIDSAIRKGANIDNAIDAQEPIVERKETKQISWNQWKQMKNA